MLDFGENGVVSGPHAHVGILVFDQFAGVAFDHGDGVVDLVARSVDLFFGIDLDYVLL